LVEKLAMQPNGPAV